MKEEDIALSRHGMTRPFSGFMSIGHVQAESECGGSCGGAFGELLHLPGRWRLHEMRTSSSSRGACSNSPKKGSCTTRHRHIRSSSYPFVKSQPGVLQFRSSRQRKPSVLANALSGTVGSVLAEASDKDG